VKPQRIFVVLDDIGRARRNIVEMTISRSRDARATEAQKIKKSAKNAKTRFF
jgi:hypothetical protein